MVEADVERAVAAFGEPDERAAPARIVRYRPSTAVTTSRAKNVSQASCGRTPFAHSLSVNAPVEPNGVTRSVGPILCSATRMSSTTPSARSEGAPRHPGKAVQQIDDRVARRRVRRVARRKVDVDRLAPPAEGRAADVEARVRPSR